MHTLVFYEPGHFHAALFLRFRDGRLARSVHVYARDRRAIQGFLGLVSGFNSRALGPTAPPWRRLLTARPAAQKRAHERGARTSSSAHVAHRVRRRAAAQVIDPCRFRLTTYTYICIHLDHGARQGKT